MIYTIKQTEDYVGNDHWNWSVWLDAAPDKLDQIRFVTWILHPTFSPSRVLVRDRESAFRLSSSGWGSFLLHAELRLKGPSVTLKLSHMLKLSLPAPDNAERPPVKQEAPAASSEHAQPKIFLSYSSEDLASVRLFQEAATRRGMQVVDANALPAGVPMEAAIRKAIRESDAVVSFSGSNYLSTWVAKEAQFAKLEGTPVFAVSTDLGTPAPSSVQQSWTADDAPSDSLQAELSTLLNNFSMRNE